MSTMFVELETPLNEYFLLCRGCLAESGEMKNIREWGLTEDFCKLTDITLHATEAISELLCTTCEEALMACKRFRTQCQQSDIVLRNNAKQKPELHSTSNDPRNTLSCTFDQKRMTYTVLAPDMQSRINLYCPYNCKDNYIKKKDLLTHLIKRHDLSKDYEIHVKYYCDRVNCSYNQNSGKLKWFDKRKLLNQHYNKVHTNKIFHCDKCNNSYSTITDFNRHIKTCNIAFMCQVCDIKYPTNERLLVHLKRRHPDVHKEYKEERKAEKRKSKVEVEAKRPKTDMDKFDYTCDSPKRSFATQTLYQVKNDVTLPSWQSTPGKSDKNELYSAKTDEISTQTVFEDILSLKSQSEDDMFFSETVSLSDIQTQTFPVEFGLSRSNKETLTELPTPDMSMKETQTCFCLYDSPKPQFRLFDSISGSPSSSNLTSTETQTHLELKNNISDVLLSFNSAETQTCFEETATL